jgi:hypothetical protein
VLHPDIHSGYPDIVWPSGHIMSQKTGISGGTGLLKL